MSDASPPQTAIDPSLEREYNNRARVPEHPRHIEGWYRDASAYRANALCELDLPYGSGQRHRLDLFHPASGADANKPIIVFFHGGYWQALDKESASHLARGANLQGFTVAIPSYDLAPDAGLPAIVACAQAATRFVAERSGQPLILAGHSAGGHLAVCVAARPSMTPVAGVMPVSGLFDLTPLISTTVNHALALDETTARGLSPIHWPAPIATKAAIVVGAAESDAYLRQSRDLAATWRSEGVQTSEHVLHGAHHFNVLDSLADPDGTLTRLLAGLA